MMKSTEMLIMQMLYRKGLAGMHFLGIHGFHIPSMGMQDRRVPIVVLMPCAITTMIMNQMNLQKDWCTAKTR